MVSRLIDIVVLVAERSQNKGKTLKELDEELLHLGYSADEIEQAMFWLSSQWRPVEWRGGDEPTRPAHRVLSPWEGMCLDSDAYGYLLRLQNLGIIDLDQFEKIMTRILPIGGEKLPLGELKTLAGSVIFNLGAEEGDDELFDVFDDVNQVT
jgi:Smg protein